MDAGGWMPEAGSWRLETGGWRLEAGGWRPEAGRGGGMYIHMNGWMYGKLSICVLRLI